MSAEPRTELSKLAKYKTNNMANKNYRYEAVIKLIDGPAVQYHNINTGLKKFHVFVKDKYKNEWIFWKARRITTKEIVGTFTNDTDIQVKAVRVYLSKQRNKGNSGFFVRVPFSRHNATINRNLFFSDKIIVETTDDYLVINEVIFNKAVENAIVELTAYFVEKGHKVAYGEIQISEIRIEKVLISKGKNNGTEPTVDYP